jgi:peptidoglycan hydrolase-like protein with peptidoglycan-binding domain
MKLPAFLMCWLGLVALSCADDLTRALQQKLKDQGFYYGEVNGQNSSETSAALRRYQIRYGLRVTGQADAETLRSLGVGRTAGPVAAASTRNVPSAPPMPEPPIQISPPATAHATPPVTRRVTPPAAASRATPPVPSHTPPISSNRNVPVPPAADQDVEREPYHGDQDRRQFYDPSDDQDRRQPYGWSDRNYGDPTGRSDDAYEAPPSPMRVPPRADSGVYALNRTAPGSIFAGSVYERAPRQVQQSVIYTVQELLARRGFYRGDVDGLPGPATSEAIVLFQRDEGLPVTGQLDQETLRELHALPGQRNGPPARDAEFTPPIPPEEQRVYRGIWIDR